MQKIVVIAAASAAVLALGACRQEPTAKPIDNETDVTAQTGATPEPSSLPVEEAAASMPSQTDAPSPAPTETPAATPTP